MSNTSPNVEPHSHSHLRSEEHTSELQSLTNLVCRLLLEKKKKTDKTMTPEVMYDDPAGRRRFGWRDNSNGRSGPMRHVSLDANRVRRAMRLHVFRSVIHD